MNFKIGDTKVLLLVVSMSLSLGACMKLKKKGDAEARPPEEMQVAVMKTLIVDRLITLERDLVGEYSSVEFLKGGRLQTNGFAVNIKTQNLIADGGELVTFPEGIKAPADQSGRSGAAVIIEAASASGILPVTLRGEAGGDGSNGASPDLALKGPQGVANTDSGDSSYNTHDPFNPICGRRANQPGNGGQGKPGYAGKNGGRGGNTGSLVVIVGQDQGFFLRLVSAPGIGGVRGMGGAGGVGGDPGPMHQTFGCMTEMTAVVGPQGPQGKDGLDGQAGQKELSCVQLGGSPKVCY